MDFIPIEAADEQAVIALSQMATEIVKEHFDPIIGPAQNDYMIEKFQTVPAIKSQLEAGYSYYVVADSGKTLGFLAFYPKDRVLHLSKFYLYKSERGKGYARLMLDFVAEAARRAGLDAIELNVNVGNPAIRAYEKMGFVRVCSEKTDIGNGFFMDDHFYRLGIKPKEAGETG